MLSAIASACLTPSDVPVVRQRLTIGIGAVSGNTAGLITAKEVGLFEARGLDVEFADFARSTSCVTAMISGQVAMCAGVGGVPLIHAVLAGAELRGVAALVDTMPYSVVADPAITAVSQLRGKRIGITTFGSSSDFAARALLAGAGLQPDDVTILTIGPQRVRFAALEAGRIDATLVTPPITGLARARGLRILIDLPNLGLDYPHSLVVVTTGMSQDHPETIREVLAAIVEGVRYFKTHRDEGMRILARYLEVEDPGMTAEAYGFLSGIISETLHVSASGMQTVLDGLATTNPAARKADPEDFLERRFLREPQAGGLHEDHAGRTPPDPFGVARIRKKAGEAARATPPAR